MDTIIIKCSCGHRNVINWDENAIRYVDEMIGLGSNPLKRLHCDSCMGRLNNDGKDDTMYRSNIKEA